MEAVTNKFRYLCFIRLIMHPSLTFSFSHKLKLEPNFSSFASQMYYWISHLKNNIIILILLFVSSYLKFIFWVQCIYMYIFLILEFNINSF